MCERQPDARPASVADPALVRSRSDACPGALTTHEAADGRLARVRVPGGQIAAWQMRELADCAEQYGDGALHLTSRGNIQLRGLADGSGVAERLAGAGLLPSPEHERVRNIVASPLTGLAGGLLDLRSTIRALDGSICARQELSTLAGRFLFGLDDGRGDIAAEGVDVCWHAVRADTGTLLLAGEDTGLRVPARHAATALVEAAAAFTVVRGPGERGAWHVHELSDRRKRRITVAVAAALGCARQQAAGVGEQPPLPVGAHPTDDGAVALVAGLTFGVFSAGQARLLAGTSERVVLTPWRSVVLPDLERDRAEGVANELESAGLLLSEREPQRSVSACIGQPGCAKSRADVRSDVTEVMRTAGDSIADGSRAAHFSGCERRCGRARADHVDVLAEDGGYRVDGSWVPVEQLAGALTHAINARGDTPGEGNGP